MLTRDRQARLGLRAAAHQRGVFVSLVVAGSPAAKAGLRFGDQLLSVGGTELAGSTTEAVHALLRYTGSETLRCI